MNLQQSIARLKSRDHSAYQPPAVDTSNGFNRRGKPYPFNGEVFGKWKVVSGPVYRKEIQKHVMLTECECGRVGEVMPSALRAKKSRQCVSCKNEAKIKT